MKHKQRTRLIIVNAIERVAHLFEFGAYHMFSEAYLGLLQHPRWSAL